MTESTAVESATLKYSRYVVFAVAVSLICLTVLAFFGVWNNDFINYDDNTYVFLNPDVIRGLDWQTVEWAFGHVNACHWVPLTWLSHALDCQLFNLNPAGHHATSLSLHMASVVLLFFVLRMMTGSVWRSALVAALFGIHPLRVESVAWVAERKDVLSGFFFMLTLLAYARFTRQPEAKVNDLQPADTGLHFPMSRYYWLALFCFACGLLSKPMLVTMPFVLLLLDYWPLQRIGLSTFNSQLSTVKQLLREKIPFFVLSGVVSVVTYLAQETQTSGVASAAAKIPLVPRLANAMHACVTYLWQTFWPVNLAAYYPARSFTLFSPVVLAVAAVLVVLTIVAVLVWRKRPHFTMGWFWYLGVLVPVSGIIQAGDMIQADRFTYLPSIGLFIMLVWPLGEFAATRLAAKIGLGAVGVAVLCILGVLTHRQVGLWKDTRTLFTHTANVTHNNHVALTFLADFELAEGRIAEATATVERILKFAPGYQRAEYLLATMLQMQGKMQEAIPHLERSTGPEVGIPAQARMVISLLDTGRFAEADAILDQLARIAPGNPDLALMKAASLRNQGRIADAIELFRSVTASQTPPLADNPVMNFEIGELYGYVGNSGKAGMFYAKAIEQYPQLVRALNNYAWLLATVPDDQLRDGARAVELAERSCGVVEWKQPIFMGTLAAAYAEAGRFEDAVKMAERARETARAQGNEPVAKRNEELLELYRQGKPYRETIK